MTRGRKKLEENKRRVTFNLAEPALAKFEMLIYDPVAKRSRWGLKSEIVEKLIEKLFIAYSEGHTTIDVRDLLHSLRN